MPIHDWTQVDDGVFHSFHNSWIGELTKALNNGLLPPDFYALGEQIAGAIGPDVLTLQTPVANGHGARPEMPGAVAVATAPPRVRITERAEMDEYALKRRSVVIRHSSRHHIVALIEIMSPGNKSSRHAMRTFLDKAAIALSQGIHLLLIDLHPPGPRDPQGVHAALWERLTDGPPSQLPDRPLTLAAYVAGPPPVAYVEPAAVGDTLAVMPLFLDPDEYVNVPLETTYCGAYEGVPRFYRQVLEAG